MLDGNSRLSAVLRRRFSEEIIRLCRLKPRVRPFPRDGWLSRGGRRPGCFLVSFLPPDKRTHPDRRPVAPRAAGSRSAWLSSHEPIFRERVKKAPENQISV